MLEEGMATADRVVNQGIVREQPGTVKHLHHQLMLEEDHMSIEPIEAGYLQLDVTGNGGEILDIVYAEQLWNGKALVVLNDNRPIDRFLLKAGRNRLEVAFAWRAYRYVQVRIRNHDGGTIFHHVGMRTRQYPMLQTAAFHSRDRQLEEIWQISARTLRLCMQDGFLDSSSREQQQWMGDGRWQAVINSYYSGDHRMHRKLIEQIGQSQDWTGLTKSRYPDGHDNTPPIPSFCLAWVSAFADYQEISGDHHLVEQWWGNIVQALKWFSMFENRDGLLEMCRSGWKGSPYFMLVICRALVKAGETPRALQVIRERYGKMIAAGAKTTWEMWSLFDEKHQAKPTHIASASHGWGTSPIVFLIEGIMGIRREAPGFRKFSMNPNLCGIEHLELSIPADTGDIRITIQTVHGTSVMEIVIPKGCTGTVCGTAMSEGTYTRRLS